jgi:hypothetical protein
MCMQNVCEINQWSYKNFKKESQSYGMLLKWFWYSMFCSFLLCFIPVHVGQQHADGEFRHLDGAAQSEDDRVEAIIDRQR